jgi:CcmD family protein
MRSRILTSLMLISILFISNFAVAQDTTEATGMRSNGKIFVVMAVCITILTGFIIYLISIDRKIGKIEKQD